LLAGFDHRRRPDLFYERVDCGFARFLRKIFVCACHEIRLWTVITGTVYLFSRRWFSSLNQVSPSRELADPGFKSRRARSGKIGKAFLIFAPVRINPGAQYREKDGQTDWLSPW
jgi:hypothetical protein